MKEIITTQEFNVVATQDKPVLLDFYADWCGPCKSQLPNVEKLAKKYEGQVLVQKVNVDRFPELAQKFGVRSIPALFILKDQNIIDMAQGYQTEAALEAFLTKNTKLKEVV